MILFATMIEFIMALSLRTENKQHAIHQKMFIFLFTNLKNACVSKNVRTFEKLLIFSNCVRNFKKYSSFQILFGVLKIVHVYKRCSCFEILFNFFQKCSHLKKKINKVFCFHKMFDLLKSIYNLTKGTRLRKYMNFFFEKVFLKFQKTVSDLSLLMTFLMSARCVVDTKSKHVKWLAERAYKL